MKRKICLLMLIFVLILSGCDIFEYKESKVVALYNGEIYEEADDWHPIGEKTSKDKAWIGYINPGEKPSPGKANKEVILYENDKDMIFISYDSKIDEVHTMHKISHSLPSIYSDSVEKIILQNGEEKYFYIEGEQLDCFLNLLETYFERKEEIVKASWKEDVSGVKIYFKENFPAYYDGNELIVKSSDGKYAVAQLEGLTISECIPLPDTLSEYIEEQLRNLNSTNISSIF
jgi:hypothetical protein